MERGRPLSPYSEGQDIVIDVHAIIEAWKGAELRRERAEYQRLKAMLDEHFNTSAAETFRLSDQFHEMARALGQRFVEAEERARRRQPTAMDYALAGALVVNEAVRGRMEAGA